MFLTDFGVVLNKGLLLDIELINKMSSDLGFDVYVIDSKLLSYLNKNISNKFPFHSPVVLGVEAKSIDKLQLIKVRMYTMYETFINICFLVRTCFLSK